MATRSYILGMVMCVVWVCCLSQWIIAMMGVPVSFFFGKNK